MTQTRGRSRTRRRARRRCRGSLASARATPRRRAAAAPSGARWRRPRRPSFAGRIAVAVARGARSGGRRAVAPADGRRAARRARVVATAAPRKRAQPTRVRTRESVSLARDERAPRRGASSSCRPPLAPSPRRARARLSAARTAEARASEDESRATARAILVTMRASSRPGTLHGATCRAPTAMAALGVLAARLVERGSTLQNALAREPGERRRIGGARVGDASARPKTPSPASIGDQGAG